jgi:hypothetical protein
MAGKPLCSVPDRLERLEEAAERRISSRDEPPPAVAEESAARAGTRNRWPPARAVQGSRNECSRAVRPAFYRVSRPLNIRQLIAAKPQKRL